MFFRTPDGNSHTVAHEAGPDCGWFAVNVGDGNSWESWLNVRQVAQAHGVTIYPWQRCHDESYLRHLMELASAHGVQPLPNVEKELENVLPPARVAKVCAEYPVDVVGWSTVAWLYNDPDFAPIANKPVLLQLFPEDNRIDPHVLPDFQRACVSHARATGFTYVGVTFQTVRAEPAWYDYHGPNTQSFYTGDNIGAGNWAKWRPA